MSRHSSTGQNGNAGASHSGTLLNASAQTFASSQTPQVFPSAVTATNGISGTHSASPSGNPTLQALLRTLPTNISITDEQTAPNADPSTPLFLAFIYNLSTPLTPFDYTTTINPYIRTLKFTLSSTTDLYYFTTMLRSTSLPSLSFPQNITSLSFPGFHWFSGISSNRISNPYLTLASHLPALKHLAFSLHSASLTTSMWGERQMVEMEVMDSVRARARKTIGCRAVCEMYDLKGLFACAGLESVSVCYVRSEIVEGFTVMGEPEGVVREVGEWVKQGFIRVGREARVEIVKEG